MKNNKKEKTQDELNFLNEILNAPFMNDKELNKKLIISELENK